MTVLDDDERRSGTGCFAVAALIFGGAAALAFYCAWPSWIGWAAVFMAVAGAAAAWSQWNNPGT